MHSPTISILSLLVAGNPQPELGKRPAEATTARQAVESSLSYLEEESVAWVENRKCATYHHVPMMLWTASG